jgi:hypothetical protein
MKYKLLNPKTIIWYKSKDTFCVRVFGWGIYGINTKASWIPFSIRAGFKKLPIIKGYFIEFMIPLWLQKMKNTIKWRLLGEKHISGLRSAREILATRKGKQS